MCKHQVYNRRREDKLICGHENKRIRQKSLDVTTLFGTQLLSLFFSLDYEAFKEAAEHFQPYIKFFATFEKSVSYKQKQQLHREFVFFFF